jgi:hypothetical protein
MTGIKSIEEVISILKRAENDVKDKFYAMLKNRISESIIKLEVALITLRASKENKPTETPTNR